MKSLLVVLTLLFAGSLVLTGCNVFEGIDETETSDPEVLLDDAELALRKDNPAEAISLLRKALDHVPADGLLRSRVEIKLATALLAERDIDVLMLRRIARNFNREDASVASKWLPATKSSATLGCKFPGAHDREEFDPVQGIDYERLNADPSQDAIDETQALLNRVFSLEETTARIPFPCDTQEDLNQQIELLRQLGLSDTEIAEALVNYAVVLSTRLTIELVTINDGEQARFFYVDPPNGSEYVSVCMNNVEVCEKGDAIVNENLLRVGCTVRLLESRARVLRSEGTAAEVSEIASFWRDRLVSGLDQPCYSVSF
ncbi:MAG: hypothetical protein GVY18_02585 [Bacteroidetes bacterium]|jgi:hypothetical protein|nr:hypothetical protein [Bacteroidota bacterium]